MQFWEKNKSRSNIYNKPDAFRDEKLEKHIEMRNYISNFYFPSLISAKVSQDLVNSKYYVTDL